MRHQAPQPGTVKAACRHIAAALGNGLSFLIWLTLFLQTGIAALGATTPAFIQERDNQVTSGNTSRATLSSKTTAGNLFVVYLIWDNTGSASVSDSLGNAYASAVAPIRWSNGKYSAQIFYTINRSGGVGTMTATFATGIKSFGIIYAHEYSGVSQPAPIDVTAVAAGTSGSLNSGSANTTNATDLLFAGGVSANSVTSPGAGYTARSTSQGNMTEDRIVSAKGSYGATASNSGGAWAMQMVAFKGSGTADITPPTVPAGLSAVALSPSQIAVSWIASTDPDNTSSQLTYGVYRNGIRIATTAAGITSWVDTGRAVSTTYSYTVSAYDPAGNGSAQSSAVQATTPPLLDTTPPTVPTNLSVTGTTTSTVSLAWTASTDNVGVAGYKIYRGGVQIGASGVASYTDTGVSASTTYSYTVSAYDAAGNNSAQTAPASATTGTPDTQAPTVSITSPANNQNISGVTTIAANAADNVGVVGVQFQLDGGNLGAELTTSPYSTSWDTSRTANGSHLLTAVARDAAGNKTTSSAVTVTVNNVSLRPYSTTFPLTENPISEGGNWINGKMVGLDWNDVQTTPGLAFGTESGTNGYDDSTAVLTGTWGPDQWAQATVHLANQQGGTIYEEVELRLRSAITAHKLTGYEINFQASSASNAYVQIVRWNGPLGNFTYVADRNGPGLHDGDVVKAMIQGSTITVYLNGTQILQGTDSTYASGAPGMGFFLQGATGLNADYGFTTFMASDGLTTDTTPPSIPANLAASIINSSQIDFDWSASTDNVAVAGYQVFRNGTQVATTTATSYADTGLAPVTTYVYTVAAYDSSNNVSAQSQQLIVTTTSGSVTPPSIVQVNNNQISSGASTAVTLDTPTLAGNTIVVYVIWNNADSVALTDSRGNTFVNVGAPVTWGTGYSAQIFYAANILGGADTVTAAFQTPVTAFGVVYVHEYTGIRVINPVDITTSASGSSASLNSGTATTTSANDLIFGAGVSDNAVTAAGSGFISRDVAYGNITEDRIAASIGPYAATATHDGKMWGMQMVAFRAAQ
jgi:chitodextrinase